MSLEKTGKLGAETRVSLQEDLLKGCLLHLHPEEGGGPRARPAATQRGEQLNFAEHPEAPSDLRGPGRQRGPRTCPQA